MGRNKMMQCEKRFDCNTAATKDVVVIDSPNNMCTAAPCLTNATMTTALHLRRPIVTHAYPKGVSLKRQFEIEGSNFMQYFAAFLQSQLAKVTGCIITL